MIAKNNIATISSLSCLIILTYRFGIIESSIKIIGNNGINVSCKRLLFSRSNHLYRLFLVHYHYCILHMHNCFWISCLKIYIVCDFYSFYESLLFLFLICYFLLPLSSYLFPLSSSLSLPFVNRHHLSASHFIFFLPSSLIISFSYLFLLISSLTQFLITEISLKFSLLYRVLLEQWKL